MEALPGGWGSGCGIGSACTVVLTVGVASREWLHLLSHKMLDPQYALFQYARDDVYTLQINPDSAVNPVRVLVKWGRVCSVPCCAVLCWVGLTLFCYDLSGALVVLPLCWTCAWPGCVPWAPHRCRVHTSILQGWLGTDRSRGICLP